MRKAWFVDSVSSMIAVLNCIRLLTRILPYIFEDPDWRGFFWSTLPGQSADDNVDVSHKKQPTSLFAGLIMM